MKKHMKTPLHIAAQKGYLDCLTVSCACYTIIYYISFEEYLSRLQILSTALKQAVGSNPSRTTLML
jgi:hypothetical protein